MLYISNFSHLYEMGNILFISISLFFFQITIYLPIGILYREKISAHFLLLSATCFFIFSLILIDFLERYFYRMLIINFYLVLLGAIIIFSLSNYFVYERDQYFQSFLLFEGIFLFFWFQVCQFFTFFCFDRFYLGSTLSFFIMLILGGPIFIVFYRKLLKKIPINRNALILLSIILYAMFIFLNAINILMFSFKTDYLRIVVMDTYIGKFLLSGFKTNIDIVTHSVRPQLLSIWIFGFIICIPIISLFQLAIKRQLNDRYIQLQNKREDELKKYIQMIESINQETRQLQHDINNVLSSLGMHIYQENVNVELMREYYDQVNQEFGLRRITKIPNGKLTYLKNPEILSLVLDKLLRVKELNIQLNLEIEEAVAFPTKRLVSIVRILAILVDNALEESQKYPGAVVRLAFVPVGEKHILIMIENYTENSKFVEHYLAGTVQSDKGKGRGQGLGIIQSLIKQNKHLNLDCKQTNHLVLFSFLVDGEG